MHTDMKILVEPNIIQKEKFSNILKLLPLKLDDKKTKNATFINSIDSNKMIKNDESIQKLFQYKFRKTI